ncbi:hypothetical protein OSTOST_11201, partial [Ostertagia ostertagi]
MADLDAELALFESEISTLVTDNGSPAKKKKKAPEVEEQKEAGDAQTSTSAVVVSTAPVISMAPTIPVIAAAPMIQAMPNPTVMAPFLPRVTTLQVPGVSIMPPPVPPPMFMSSQGFRPPPGFPMPMPNIFLPHQLRQQPTRQSATIESAPKIYSSEVPTSNASTGQTATAPVTFALASDIEAMEKKNEHPSASSSSRSKDSRPLKPKKYLRAGGGQV